MTNSNFKNFPIFALFVGIYGSIVSFIDIYKENKNKSQQQKNTDHLNKLIIGLHFSRNILKSKYLNFN